MAGNMDIDRNIKDAEDLIKESGVKQADITKEYDEISKKWNDFLDDQLTSSTGSTLPAGTDEEAKIDALTESMYYSDEKAQSKFISQLKNEVKKRDTAREDLKQKAQEVLDKQRELAAINKGLIEQCRTLLNADIEKEEKLDLEIEALKNEISANEQKINERVTRIGILEAEIADPAITPEDKKAKTAELNALRKEEKDLSDKNIELDGNVKNKTAEKNKLDVKNKKTKLDDLEAKNKELEDNIEKNQKEFKDKGIELSSATAPAQAMPSAAAPQENANQKAAAAVQGGQVQAAPAQALVKLSSREIANNMAREFRNAKTTAEQRKIIDGYGYSDIASMMEYLGPIQKRKLRNVLKEEIACKKVPSGDDFKDHLKEILGSETEAKNLYISLFSAGEARKLNDLDAKELRNIQSAFDTFESKRSEIAKKDPTLLKYFDEKVAHFVKYGALIDKGTIGGRMGAFFNIGGKKVIRNKLVNSMKDYTMNAQEEKVKKIGFANDIRSALGMEVIDMPNDPANENRNRDTDYTDPLQDRRASGKRSTSKER